MSDDQKNYTFYMIAYDISNNRRRAKLAKYLESLGARVQGSVFEVYLTRQEFDRMVKKCKQWIKAGEDSLRIYQLCETCCAKINVIGKNEITPSPELTIV